MRDNKKVGAANSRETMGAVKLMPILMLPEVKSVCDIDEAGITMYAVLETNPPAMMLIIRAI